MNNKIAAQWFMCHIHPSYIDENRITPRRKIVRTINEINRKRMWHYVCLRRQARVFWNSISILFTRMKSDKNTFMFPQHVGSSKWISHVCDGCFLHYMYIVIQAQNWFDKRHVSSWISFDWFQFCFIWNIVIGNTVSLWYCYFGNTIILWYC